MTYPIGTIILIEKYRLPTEEKDKFFIVIDQHDNAFNLVSMTTSKFYFAPELIKHGIINKNSGASMYCFEAGKIIGINGFAFKEHTFVNHNDNINEFSFELLSSYNVKCLDKLTPQELQDFIYSFYQYKDTRKKYKIILEDILNKIC